MSDFWSFLFSPTGLALYAVFWALKLMFGAWALRQAYRMAPVRVQNWARGALGRETRVK